MHALPQAAFLWELQRRYCAFPREILNDPEMLQLFLEVLQADFSLFETIEYRHEATLECGISAYGGAEDHAISESEILAWRAQTRDRFSSEVFPGGHFFVKSNALALLYRLSREIRPYLDREIPIHHAARF
jgi:medium-chain acyl-[acyl-carrier-protein] hydrolase